MDIEGRYKELLGTGISSEDAVRQIFREDYSANVKELMRVTGKDAAGIGRLKANVARERKGVTGSRESPAGREMEPPIVTEFKAAIDDLLERSSERFKDHLCVLFERQADNLVKNRTAFENFLLRNGLTPVQSNGVIERMIVSREPPPGGGAPQAVQIPGLGYVVFQSTQPSGAPGQPIIVQNPGGGVQPADTSKLESRIDKLDDKISSFIDAGGGRGQGLVRRARRPIFNEDGSVKTDKDGNMLFEESEEPWEPGARDPLLETILPILVRQATGEKGKPVDEEALVLKVKEKIGGGKGEVTTEAIREAVRAETTDIKRDIDSIKKDQEKREREAEIERAVDRARTEDKALIDRLTAELGERGGYAGLSDSQATMRYQKDLIEKMVDTVNVQVASVREDLRPLILQQAVQSLKQQGMSEDVISQFLSSARQKLPPVTGVSEDRKTEAVDRIKQWAKT